jgi:hypothetical protein
MKAIIFMHDGESMGTTDDFDDVLIDAGFQLFACSYSINTSFVRLDTEGFEIVLLVYPQTLSWNIKTHENIEALAYMGEWQKNGTQTFEATYMFEDFFKEWRLHHSDKAHILQLLEIQK